MKIKIFAAVLALIFAASLLFACGKKTSDLPIGTIAPDPDASVPADTGETAAQTDTDGTDTEESTDDAEAVIPEDYVSSGTFNFKRTAEGETWLDTYEGKDSIVVIPAEDPEDGSPVTGIDVWAFRDNETVRRIVVPDSVKTIEKNAFMYCSALEDIKLPESLETLGTQAFYRCSSLKKISIPEGLETLGYATFMFCESLEEVTLPKTLSEIGDNVFSHCDALLTIYYRGPEADWWKITFSESAMPPTWYTAVYDYAG